MPPASRNRHPIGRSAAPEWHSKGHGQLLRIAKAGDREPEVLVDGLDAPYHISVSDDAVYVAVRDAGTILRVDKQ
jgi:hypothetical protein